MGGRFPHGYGALVPGRPIYIGPSWNKSQTSEPPFSRIFPPFGGKIFEKRGVEDLRVARREFPVRRDPHGSLRQALQVYSRVRVYRIN
jgi:hypothetical protein